MMNKTISILLIFVFLFGMVLAQDVTPDDILWDGAVSLNLDKELFSDNEEITGIIRVYNNEAYPIVGQRIAIHLGEGTYDYPSQFAKDNIIAEKQIDDIWIIPEDYQDFEFSFPAQGAGEYHVDVYSWVLKSKLVGASAIYLGPITREFTVQGEKNEEKAIINRELSFFGLNDTIGPVGFPVEPGGEFSGTAYIYNPSENKKQDLKLGVSICDWASVFCKDVEEIEFEIGELKAGYGKVVDIAIDVPEIPSAYAVKMTLYKGSEIESIYRSRVIAEGGTAKLRKIYLDGLDNANYSLSAILSGSPDHFNFPDFEDFSIEMEVFLEDESIEKDSVDVEIIGTTIENEDGVFVPDVIMQFFDIKASLFDHICVRVEKDSRIFEEECFDADIKAIQEAYDIANPAPTKVDWDYKEEKEELTITLDREEGMDVRVTIFSEGEIFYEKEISETSHFEETIWLAKDNYTMIVDDLVLKEQMVYDLFFMFEASQLENPIIADVPDEFKAPRLCEEKICEDGFSCSGQVYESSEGLCCTSECVPSIGVNSFEILSLPLIVWVALILATIAAFFARKAFMKVRK